MGQSESDIPGDKSIVIVPRISFPQFRLWNTKQMLPSSKAQLKIETPFSWREEAINHLTDSISLY